ncbi:hypothetical protein LSCM1_07216 [Leishmania martiniquensis]|uniref:Uncharacterized protein n=1 Tax=Leishmania martiniquensis TaxID=1580590 RepID=A0A836I0F7_9TRYP|nr:hypothetical protein LSCM1_07216 [Leishmania martiniquensis]
MFTPLNRFAAGSSRWAMAAAATPLPSDGATTQRAMSSTPLAAALSMNKRFAATASGRAAFLGAYRAFRRGRSADCERRYMTLSMYLDRLPPGFRELLLWSPLLALLCFVCHQARAYYLEEEEPWYYVALPPRWRYRADGEGSGAAVRVPSLVQRAPPSFQATASVAAGADCPSAASSFRNACQGSDSTASFSIVTYAFRAGDVQDAAATAAAALGAPLASSPLVAAFHEVRVRLPDTDEGAPPAATPSTSPLEERYRYGVWGAPLVVLRDPATQRVTGYTTG